MHRASNPHSHASGWPFKLAFVTLVVLPFVPAIAISTVPALARGSCSTCLIVARSVSEFLATALQAASLRGAGFSVRIAVAWLVICYLVLSLGWRRTASRVLLALLVTLLFVFLPSVIPRQALGISSDAVHIMLIQIWSTFI